LPPLSHFTLFPYTTLFRSLQPAFVVSVGDLIEGYSKDPAVLAEQWKEFQGYVHKLQMPFFYVPGNHDVANAVEAKEWEARFGRRDRKSTRLNSSHVAISYA